MANIYMKEFKYIFWLILKLQDPGYNNLLSSYTVRKIEHEVESNSRQITYYEYLNMLRNQSWY
jgi:hypothetical protein